MIKTEYSKRGCKGDTSVMELKDVYHNCKGIDCYTQYTFQFFKDNEKCEGEPVGDLDITAVTGEYFFIFFLLLFCTTGAQKREKYQNF